MRVEPEMPDHPKIQRLKRRLGALQDFAVEGVIRLWGHCQASQRGGTWRGADSEYVEIVSNWKGAPGEFFKALVEVGLVEEAKGQLVIHDWDRFNSKARAAWENGNKGGRPGLTQDSAQLMLGKPKRNPTRISVNPNSVSVNPNSVSANQIVSQSVSQSVRSTEGGKNKGGGAPRASESPGGETNGAEVAASRTRFAALRARQQELARQGEEDLAPAERAELAKINRDLETLQRNQAAGRF